MSRPVLLASVDGDAHVLPLHVLTALLVQNGVRVRLLGASTPLPALRESIRRLRPQAVFLWAQLTGPMNTEFVRSLANGRAGANVVLGGPGWDDPALPDEATRVSGLDEAMRALAPH